MKDTRWLPVIAVLNVFIAAAFIFGFGRWIGPGPQRLTPFFLFRIALSSLAVAAAPGLWMRQDWARRWSIVLWAVAMTFAIPVAVLGGFRLGVAGVLAGLVIAVALPMLVISHLSQPSVKVAVGAPNATYTGRKTVGFVVAGVGAGLVVMALLALELVKAIGRGLR